MTHRIHENGQSPEVRAGDARLRRMSNVEGVGILILDATGTVIDANDAFLHMTGYSRRDVETRTLTWRAMTPPEYVAASEAQLKALERTGRIGPYEKEYLHADGSRSWLLLAGATIDDDGTFVEYCIDVSDRKRAEAVAREIEARFRAVVDLVPDLLWQSAPDGSTVWYNARWYEYTGQSPNEATRWGWTKAIHPDDRARSAANYARAARTGRPLREEHRIQAADGTYRWFLVRAEPQKDDAGRIVRWFGAATDVHEQRIAMQEVERQVTERTAELHDAETTRDDLRRQLSSAEEAERRRLARELHDQLGQHLTAFALGLADARRLLDAGQSADGRLSQLEELARLMTRDARYLALELRPPELDDVGLESALRTYIEQWGARYGVEVDLAVTGAAADAPIPGETGTTIYRIAQEALTNVARYAEAKHVSVLLEKPDGSVRLIVEDDGQGFDVATTTTRARHERRIGLAGMRERATLVGGTLEVESTPGGGTTVYARVPLSPFPRLATHLGGDPAALDSRAANAAREARLDLAALSRRAAAAIDTSLALARRREAVLDTVRVNRRDP